MPPFSKRSSRRSQGDDHEVTPFSSNHSVDSDSPSFVDLAVYSRGISKEASGTSSNSLWLTVIAGSHSYVLRRPRPAPAHFPPVKGGLEFLSQNHRKLNTRRGPGNHHPFESYGPVMDNVLNSRILPLVRNLIRLFGLFWRGVGNTRFWNIHRYKLDRRRRSSAVSPSKSVPLLEHSGGSGQLGQLTSRVSLRASCTSQPFATTQTR